MIHNVMDSIELLSDAMLSFAEHCVSGLALDEPQIRSNTERNLSTITLLAPKLGYDAAAKIAHEAHEMDITLGEAAEYLGLCSRVEFDALFQQQLEKLM